MQGFGGLKEDAPESVASPDVAAVVLGRGCMFVFMRVPPLGEICCNFDARGFRSVAISLVAWFRLGFGGIDGGFAKPGFQPRCLRQIPKLN